MRRHGAASTPIFPGLLGSGSVLDGHGRCAGQDSAGVAGVLEARIARVTGGFLRKTCLLN